MLRGVGKRLPVIRHDPRWRVAGSPVLHACRWLTLAIGALVWTATLAACVASAGRITITATALEAAPATAPPAPQRHILSDPAELRPLYQPLGRRIGLIEVRDRLGWDRLARAIPDLGPCPDLRRGMIIGIASESGTPLDGGWPLQWETIRMCRGAALLEAHFNGGNYLPDGAIYLETAYVEQANAVLAVAVDGLWYYPR